MAIDPASLAWAQNYINQQYNGSRDASGTYQQGTPWDFTSGDFSQWLTGPGKEYQQDILGLGNAAGWSPADLESVLGVGQRSISAYQDSLTPSQINAGTISGASDLGWLTPDELKSFLSSPGNTIAGTSWQGGADGGLVYSGPAATDTTGATDSGDFTTADRHSGAASGYNFSGNPYLDSVAGAIGNQFTNVLQDQWLPQIRDQSVAAGGLGGSRAGVAQGLAIDRAGQGLSSALSNLYGGAYENQAGRDLQRYGIDTNADLQQQSINNSFQLGQRGLDLGFQNSDYNMFNTNRQLDLSQLGLGAQLYGNGMNGMWSPISNATNAFSPWSGFGTSTSNSNQGGGLLGALGGAGAGYQWWRGLGG